MSRNGVMFFDGEKLRALREGRGVTFEEVAVAIGRSASTINNYELNDYSPPPAIIEAIARFFKVDLAELFAVDERATAAARNLFPDGRYSGEPVKAGGYGNGAGKAGTPVRRTT